MRKNPVLAPKLWNSSPSEFLMEIEGYIKEFEYFNPDNFLELKFHLVKGKTTKEHEKNLCEIIDAQDLCKKCIYVNTEKCTRSIQIKDKKSSAAERILENIVADLELFSSDDKAYARFEVKGHLEIHELYSDHFQRYLSYLFYKDEGKPPSNDAIVAASNVLSAKAHFEGAKLTLQNRVAWHNDVILWDMTNEAHQAIQVTPAGWQVLNRTDVPLFIRYPSNHLPAAYPVTSLEPAQSALKILDFLNHDETDLDQRLLIMCVVLSYFIPDIPHPIIIAYGEQGSAKSSFFRVIKKLVDPSKAKIMSFPSNLDDLGLALNAQWFVGFDNVGDLKPLISDFLCRAVTGDSRFKRTLYKTSDFTIYTYSRCVGLNGINNAAQAPDLLDRSVLFNLPRIERTSRKLESELDLELDSQMAEILGGSLSIISEAMKIFPTISLDGYYRLADWTKWACAISEALGFKSEDFLRAYENNRLIQTDEAISNDDVATCIVQLMEVRKEWKGRATDLLNDLNEIAQQNNITISVGDWPKAPKALSRRLNKIKTSLREAGIKIERVRVSSRKELILTYDRTKSKIRVVQPGQKRLDDDNDDIEDPNIVMRNPVFDAELCSHDDNDDNDDISDKVTDGIPKEVSKGGRPSEILKKEQDKRFKAFRKKVLKRKNPSDWITQIDLDKMYRKGRERVNHDLLDWENQGLVFASRGKKELRWKISELMK